MFLYEIKKNSKKAIELAKSTIKEFDKVKNKLDENEIENKDAFSIINLLRENIEMWEK